MQQILMGNEAIALGLIHANVDVVSGYPGTPSSEIITNFQKLRDKMGLKAYAEWASNEKVGYEVAYAHAMSGKNACATMKQVGLNVAADAVMNSAYIGNIGAMILLSADDPGFYSSQTEQDSRVFAKFARIPALDPSSPQEAYDFIRLSVEISRKFEIPVMFRSIMRVAHARQNCEVADSHEFNPPKGEFIKNTNRWAGVPPGPRHQQGIELLEKIEQIRKFNYENLIKPKIEKLKGGERAEILCITSGVASSYVSEAVSELKINADVLKIDMPTPLPFVELNALCKTYKKVVVFEEPYACIEEDLSGENIYGKKTSHVHKIHEFGKDKVFEAFANLGVVTGENPYKAPKFSEFELPKRPPNLCPGCPHRDIFYTITKIFRTKQSIYASDIGCYTLALNQNAIDHFLCMGASISTASGFSLANPDKTVVATIGDSTFLHSGMPPLINAVYQKHKFILVILDNSTTAMTGRQTTPERASGEIDIKKLVEGCGIKCHEYFYEPNLDKTAEFFKGLKKEYETSEVPVVAVIRQFCVLDKSNSKIPQIYAVVNEAKCVECDTCVGKYKCPAMSYNENHKVQVDPFLCTGCSACINGLCPTNAFEVRSK